MLRHPFAPIFEKVLRFPRVEGRRPEFLDMTLHRFAEAVVGKDAHEFPEIDISHAFVASDDNHVLVIGIDAGFAPIGRTAKCDWAASKRVNQHELCMDPVDVDPDGAGFFEPAVNPVHKDTLAQGHADVWEFADAFNVVDYRFARGRCPAVDVFVQQGEAQYAVVIVIDPAEILHDAEGEGHK